MYVNTNRCWMLDLQANPFQSAKKSMWVLYMFNVNHAMEDFFLTVCAFYAKQKSSTCNTKHWFSLPKYIYSSSHLPAHKAKNVSHFV